MKNIFALTLLLALTSCGGYESLNTPFNFHGTGINLFGSDAKPAKDAQSNTFEIVVNAPAGTAETTANDLFDQEAKRVCQGKTYSKQIVSSGTAQIRSFGVKGVKNDSVQQAAPSLRGYVTCQQ